ncbi:shewanella-like protein phosphatase 1 isoform X2 [Gastrolobium bilobum]|uniref:shewanella-like protein phosphatase 1 isoform X2 n=1 Tax=Gastrolobium bilobum TaxID=150636 RepID=UPI002AB0CC5D|nr:shewanella-like protein phosphatase 1 isoform X2 [Gastrolobium bilobum]
MASLCLNSLPVPPSSHPRKLTETSLSSSSSLLLDNNNDHSTASAFKPIVVSGDPPTFVSAPGRRILAVGDLHGDLKQARSALEMAGVLSSDGQNLWTGGETVLIQLGDILDRGEDEIAILSLLRSLDKQAKAQGGAVFQVNGNHETMNVEGDFRYVESGGFDECDDFLEYINNSEDDWEETFTGWVDVSERWKEDRTMSRSYWGPWNVVKDRGKRQSLPDQSSLGLVGHWHASLQGTLLHLRSMTGSSAMVAFFLTMVCSILEETLQAIGAKAMVVGHTPQTIGVNCKYNCSIWRVDVGMSSGVLNSKPEVLEIIDNKARVIRSKRDRYGELQATAYT